VVIPVSIELTPQLAAPIFEKVAIIGVGLIGSSLARAFRRVNAAKMIALADVSTEVLERARELGLGDDYHSSSKFAVRDAEAVIFCAPVGANSAIATEVSEFLKRGAIVSDVGSVKAAAIDAISPHLPADAHLVPAHPVAGTEQSGPDAGFSKLFVDRWCILTPQAGTCGDAVQKIKKMWESFGANVEIMTPEHHDLVLAITSHVPHLIAYNIVGTAADLEEVTRQEVIKFSAGGFRDFTRIAASDPTMWRDVFLNNKEAVLEMLSRFTQDLTALRQMIDRGDGEGLFNLFTRTRAIRMGIVKLRQETAEPDFGRRTVSDPPWVDQGRWRQIPPV
jgi:cyclohexadieny/prephenate dehydrogenase